MATIRPRRRATKLIAIPLACLAAGVAVAGTSQASSASSASSSAAQAAPQLVFGTRTASKSIPANSIASVDVKCVGAGGADATIASGGGFYSPHHDVFVHQSVPLTASGSHLAIGWRVTVQNRTASAQAVTVHVVCGAVS